MNSIAVAQLAERRSPKAKVAGSMPACGANHSSISFSQNTRSAARLTSVASKLASFAAAHSLSVCGEFMSFILSVPQLGIQQGIR